MTSILDDIEESPGVVATALAANDEPLREARRLLGGRSLVRTLGIGSSRHVAGVAAAALEALALAPSAVADAPGAGVPLPAWRRDHAAVVVSQSGETPALLEAVEAARRHDVAVIAIVNELGTRLQALANVPLVCGAGAERVVPATKTVVAQIAVARALAQPVSESERGALVDSLRAALAVDIRPALDRKVPEVVVAGGVAGGWLADEVALKFAEVAGRAVAAEPLVEYLHGPVAATRATVLALVDGDDPNLSLLPSTTMHTRVGRDDDATITIATTGEPFLDLIVRLVVAQRLVVGWARRTGEDPDADRGLHKITATR